MYTIHINTAERDYSLMTNLGFYHFIDMLPTASNLSKINTMWNHNLNDRKKYLQKQPWYYLMLGKSMTLMTYMQNVWFFNSLWPGDATWQHRSQSTLAQVMACCLTAPSHCLNQSCLPLGEVLWHSPWSNFIISAQFDVIEGHYIFFL